MEIQKRFVSTCINPPQFQIPKMCYDSRTIYVNKMNILFLVKDRREGARQLLDALLPVLVPLSPPEKVREVFWNSPDSSWFEFDYSTKVLSYCSMEKK